MSAARDLAPFYVHGGRVEAARAAFGGENWIDLSTGIAPWAWPIDPSSVGFERLPEPEAILELEAAAARAFGASDSGCVIAVPGTDLALRLLALVLEAERPAVVTPGYAGHLAAWPHASAIAYESTPSDQAHDLLVLASPANPDGRTADAEQLLALSATMTVVIDEAYADPEPGLCSKASDRLIVLRSFGKFYGLPGLRLGFVVTGPRLAARLRSLLGDWPISSAAAAIGTAAYRAAAWRDAQQRRIAEMGMLLDQALSEAGIEIVGSAPLFRLLSCDNAAELFAFLARRGILTRPFADQPLRLRIGLPADAAALARLAAALQECR